MAWVIRLIYPYRFRFQVSMHDSDSRTREALVSAFRQRIAEGRRIRLTQEERSDMIRHFVDRLSRCESEEEAIQVCKEEISLLEEGYPVPSIASQYLPEWRRAIALAVEEGRLPRQDMEPTEFGKIY
ncbi:MAG: hypothetical protein D6694_10330, partial [Gammaproteobacteria bacterium]